MTDSPVFALPPHLAGKAGRERTGCDEDHFTAMATALEGMTERLADQLERVRRSPARPGQELLERDLQTHQLAARLRLLGRYRLDLCLGRMVPDARDPVYVGRVGLKDDTGRQLLLDWRSPAAKPFFAATLADPMGLTSRRRYRWSGGRVVDYWDDVFTSDHRADLAPDRDSALLATLRQARTSRMQDVLATIAADQDAIIRADAHEALLVEGGPGTGKTVVALHRAAYLLYADPRLNRNGAAVLFIGPHQLYLSYIAEVLPSLGEDGVQIATLDDLVPESATAGRESDPRVAALKARAAMVAATEPAVAFYEEAPTSAVTVDTHWGETRLTSSDWADAFAAVEPGTPHNEARAQIWDELGEIAAARLVDLAADPQADADPPTPAQVTAALQREPDLVEVIGRAWPLLDPADLVADLWEVPAYLRRCAPWLTRDEAALLRRRDPRAWTDADLPLIDAARHRVGDPDTERHERVRRAVLNAAEREMDAVVDHLVAADYSEMKVMSMLSRSDLRAALVDEQAVPAPARDRLAGPFTHVVVDEAQELTDAQWAMILRRCPSRSLTIVGDRAQARGGFPGTWAERLAGAGLDRVTHTTLSLNYRTPAEVMAAAEPVIRAVLPDAAVPTSIRETGTPVRHIGPEQVEATLTDWLAAHPDGTACVIGHPISPRDDRVRSLDPQHVSGLEFDLVVLDPAGLTDDYPGTIDRYVAMTRTTSDLMVVHRSDARRAR